MRLLFLNLIVSGKVSRDEMLRLGRRLAEFYAASERNEQIDRYGGKQVIEFNTEENFRQLEPFVGNLLRKDRFDFVIESSRGFFRDRGRLFQRRIAARATSATVMETSGPSMSISSTGFR